MGYFDGDLLQSPGLLGNNLPAPAYGFASGYNTGPLHDYLTRLSTQYAQPDPYTQNMVARLQGQPGTLTPDQRSAALQNVTMGIAGAVGPNMIRAFHGSPYDFNAFDLSKIGTGEGAQAYGHGLYFAGNPDVAESYKYATSGRNAEHSFEGSPINTPQDYWAVQDKLNAEDWRQGKAFEQYMKSIEPNTDLRWRQIADWNRGDPQMSSAIEALKQRVSSNVPTGKMYEVALHADPASLLDWDKPLSQQSPQVQEAVKRTGYSSILPATGQNAYYGIQASQRAPQFASASLESAGIPGIQYLDAGSRGAGVGSHNYVMFNPSLIEILRKYGVLAPTVGGAGLLGAQEP